MKRRFYFSNKQGATRHVDIELSGNANTNLSELGAWLNRMQSEGFYFTHTLEVWK